MFITHFTLLLFLSTALIAQDTGSLCNPFEGMCEGIFLKMEMVIIILWAFSSLLSSFLEIVIISELQNVETKQECADICHLTPKCSWFSHSEDEKTCFAMESCFKADTDISNYYSGTVTLI